MSSEQVQRMTINRKRRE